MKRPTELYLVSGQTVVVAMSPATCKEIAVGLARPNASLTFTQRVKGEAVTYIPNVIGFRVLNNNEVKNAVGNDSAVVLVNGVDPAQTG